MKNTYKLIVVVLLLTTGAIGYLMIRNHLVQMQDQLDVCRDEQDVDNGVLQLIFEDSYHRDHIALTEVTVSAYSSTRQQTDSTPHTTASGANTMVGQIAVSRDLINQGVRFGSVVYLQGLGVFWVEDTMHPRWTNRVDIWCTDVKACKLFGLQKNITMIWMKGENP